MQRRGAGTGPAPVPTNIMRIGSTWPYVAKSSEPQDAKGDVGTPSVVEPAGGGVRGRRVVAQRRLAAVDHVAALAAVRGGDPGDERLDPGVQRRHVLRPHRPYGARRARLVGNDVGRARAGELAHRHHHGLEGVDRGADGVLQRQDDPAQRRNGSRTDGGRRCGRPSR